MQEARLPPTFRLPGGGGDSANLRIRDLNPSELSPLVGSFNPALPRMIKSSKIKICS